MQDVEPKTHRMITVWKLCFIVVAVVVSMLLALIFSNTGIIACGLLFLLIFLGSFWREKNVWGPLNIIFLIAIGYMLILYFGELGEYGQPYYIGGSDDWHFENYSNQCIERGLYTPLQVYKNYYWYNSVGYLWVMSWIMRIANLFGGYHTVIGRLMNIYILMALGMLTYKCFKCRYNYDEKVNRKVLYFTTIFPNILYISSHVFRDTLSIFLVFGCFYISDKYEFKNEKNAELNNNLKKKIDYILIVLMAALATFIRTQNLVIIAVCLFFNHYYNNRLTRNRVIGLFLIGMVGIVIAIETVLPAFFRFQTIHTGYFIEEQQGLSNFIWRLPIFPVGAIVRFMYGLVSPFPANILKIFLMFESGLTFLDVLTSVGVIIQILLLPYLMINIKKIDDMTWNWLGSFLMVVLTTFTFRHFIYIYPFQWILIFRQYGKASRSVKQKNFFMMMSLLFIAGMAYLLIK